MGLMAPQRRDTAPAMRAISERLIERPPAMPRNIAFRILASSDKPVVVGESDGSSKRDLETALGQQQAERGDDHRRHHERGLLRHHVPLHLRQQCGGEGQQRQRLRERRRQPARQA